jgi:cellulose synthase/poly-beta-1,6-N-acetylglucosamine synthase-like glycosyltransferase
MLVEVNQLYDMMVNLRPHGLILFFLSFVLFPTILKKVTSLKYKNYFADNNNYSFPIKSPRYVRQKVSIIVPVYDEDPHQFDFCLNSISMERPGEIIVVHDKKDKEIDDIALKYGCRLIKPLRRLGKRKSLAIGVKIAKYDLLLFVDSDTMLEKNTISKMLMPMQSDDVGIVSCVKKVNPASNSFGGYISWKMSNLMESVRVITDKSLDGRLVVSDGRCSLYRKELILPLLDRFVNEYFLGTLSEIGDDRFLTREIRKKGYRICLQADAVVTTYAQPSLKKFIRQQLRWRRSGYKFFLKDIKEKVFVKNGASYLIQILTYYLGPLFFVIAIATDMFVLPITTSFIEYNQAMTIASIVLGCTMITMIRQAILLGRVEFRDSLFYGVIGFFVLFPVSIYALLTIKKQSTWGTRGKEVTDISQGSMNFVEVTPTEIMTQGKYIPILSR